MSKIFFNLHVLYLVTFVCSLGVPTPGWAGQQTASSHQRAFPKTVQNIILKTKQSRFKFHVAIADTPQKKSQGLMFVRQIPARTGLLFIYAPPAHATIWMKNTPAPLDIIFFDKNSKAIYIKANAKPLSQKTIDPGQAVKYILEVKGGTVRKLGLHLGMKISFIP